MAKRFTVEEYAGQDQSGRPIKRQVAIPDGKWVVHASTAFSKEEMWDDSVEGNPTCTVEERTRRVVGPEPGQKYALDRRHSRRHWRDGSSVYGSSFCLLVGDQPFGVVLEKKEDGQRVEGLWFSCARQIHKGELGRRPQITRPQFAREAPREDIPEVSNLTGKPIRQRDRRRGKYGWARLADVAALVGMTPEEMVRRYFAFTDAEHPRLQVLFGTREQIHGQRIPWDSWTTFYELGLPQLFDCDPSTIWIRQGFANVVLYLHHFGYIPPLPQEVDIKVAVNG